MASIPKRTVFVTVLDKLGALEIFSEGSKGEWFHVKFGVHNECPLRIGSIAGCM
jgi:hypothetical protein